MKVFKKNQVIAFTIGLMVITAGYLSFINNGEDASLKTGAIADSEDMASIGDAKLVSANVVDENVITNEADNGNNNTVNNNTQTNQGENVVANNGNKLNDKANNEDQENESTGEADKTNSKIEDDTVDTSNKAVSTDEYFMNSRLERNTMYSQQIENYQSILDNTNVSEAQKKIAQEEITRINNEQNAIMIAENLIRAKGIDDLIIFINEDSVNVIVKENEPKKEEVAQIQNIVTRELKADIADVHIMNKK